MRAAVSYPAMAAALVCALAAPLSQAQKAVEYNRDILPILSANCYPCHGPDDQERKRNIRFDTREGLFGKTMDGVALLVPGDPEASELFKRMAHGPADDRMPPPESKLVVTDEDIGTLRRWIEDGAEWQGHWAFIPPVKPEIPKVSDAAWCQNEIDYFILEALDKAGLAPSEEADRVSLIRRASLDLTGLPPTPEDVAAFLADTSPNAYEKVIDRLLASPHYGERMAFIWLDAARYSDTNGYQRDTIRIMWPWRDWVIDAFNDNMPYDAFAIEQLAGDLLPDATLDQRIATGFNRNHRINGEGGIIPEEYAVEYVADRVSTTSTAFMGLTMECARCHTHKFDPFTQKEFYELFAFFNNIPEEGKGRERGNDKPFVEVPTAVQAAQKKELTEKLAALERQLTGPDDRLDPLQRAWERDLGKKFNDLDWQAVPAASATAKNGTVLETWEDGSLLATGPNPDQEVFTYTFEAPRDLGAFKLELFTDGSLPETGPGRPPNGNVVLSGFDVTRAPANAPDQTTPVAVATALADYQQSNDEYAIRNAIDTDPGTGWATGSPTKREGRTAIFVLDEAAAIAAGDHVTVNLRYESGHPQHVAGHFRLSHSPSREIARWSSNDLGPWHYIGLLPSDAKENVILETPFEPEQGYDPARTYGANGLRWEETPDWQDGGVVKFDTKEVGAHFLHRTIHTDVSKSVTLSLGSNDAIKVWIDGRERFANNNGRTAGPDQDRLTVFLEEGTHDLLIKIVNFGGESAYYFKLLDDDGQGLLAMMDLLETPVAERSPQVQQQITTLFRERDKTWRDTSAEAERVRSDIEVLQKSIITTMVMEEMETPRDTYLLKRGVYDKPDTTERLLPSVPAVLGEMDESLPKNRLGFAEWLMNPEHPLTARVRVNHYWQMYFGKGIVKTSEDFGTQGAAPTHPDLLDWLAVRFMESDWDVKAMQKLIVMSATYRQRSNTTAEQNEIDPANVYLSHLPRVRLPAEMIRDQALAASGLLSETIGGPSVKPYQPGDLWSALTFQNMDEYDTNFYVQDEGDKLYRRGLYTYWKRTIRPPRMQIFDAAGREMCSMRNDTTNTPLQALALLNDTTYVEAARFLGQRMIREGGDRSVDRVRYGFKLVLARDPNPVKEQILLSALNDYQSHFIRHTEDATKLVAVGDSRSDAAIPDTEMAAYTMLASVLLNLDETVTRE